MIPRPAARRPATELVVTLRSSDGGRTAWSPVAPRTGWSPASAFQAALDYGADLAGGRGAVGDRRVVLAAHQALLAAVPGLKRTELLERLQGIDPLAAHFGDAAITATPVDDDLAELAPITSNQPALSLSAGPLF